MRAASGRGCGPSIPSAYIPSFLYRVTEYVPTIPELVISLGVYGIGMLCLSLLLKIALSVKAETAVKSF